MRTYPSYPCVHNLKLSQSVVGVSGLIVQDHLELSVRLGSCHGPVSVAFGPPTFLLFGQHDNGGTFLLPHHLPEVVRGVGEGALGGNISTSIEIALNR